MAWCRNDSGLVAKTGKQDPRILQRRVDRLGGCDLRRSRSLSLESLFSTASRVEACERVKRCAGPYG
jgi:hypothetical protein